MSCVEPSVGPHPGGYPIRGPGHGTSPGSPRTVRYRGGVWTSVDTRWRVTPKSLLMSVMVISPAASRLWNVRSDFSSKSSLGYLAFHQTFEGHAFVQMDETGTVIALVSVGITTEALVGDPSVSVEDIAFAIPADHVVTVLRGMGLDLPTTG